MKTTVIVCTYNRCESLARTLESTARLELPRSVEWEILVVDNNSNDRTSEVVAEFCARLPGHFRYHFESRQGKSHALNSGIQAAKGEVIAFIDDDVIVEPTWLQSLTSTLHQGEWTGAGGKILPQGLFSPPNWIPLNDRYALAPLALFDPPMGAGPLGQSPFGANMAFHRKVFERHGGFRADLGPSPGSGHPQKSEDSEFGNRLIAAGERLRYEPSAVVYHAVPSHRVQQSYFLEWWFDKARADIRAFGIPDDTKWCVSGIPVNLFRRLAVWTVRWMVALKPQRRFGAKVRVWSTAGKIQECFRVSREGKRQQN